MTRLGARYTIDPGLPVEVRRRRLLLLNRFMLLPFGTHVTPVVASGVPAEWVVPPRADPGAVLLYLHGGAYVAGSPVTHRVFVARLAKAIGARALVPDYRLAPEHRFPCAVEDVVCVYAWLMGQRGADSFRIVVRVSLWRPAGTSGTATRSTPWQVDSRFTVFTCDRGGRAAVHHHHTYPRSRQRGQ